MKYFPKRYGFITISFFVLFNLNTSGQDFLNINNYNENLAIGLVENYYGFAGITRSDWGFAFHTSLFTESIATQLFSLNLSKKFQWDNLVLIPAITTGGIYKDGFEFFSIGGEVSYSPVKALSLNFSPILLYTNEGLEIRYHAGIFGEIINNEVSLFLKYSPYFYLPHNNYNLTAGLQFKERKLKAYTGFQVPSDLDFTYSRVVFGFIYIYNNAAANTETK